jgi:hypothetical protein
VWSYTLNATWTGNDFGTITSVGTSDSRQVDFFGSFWTQGTRYTNWTWAYFPTNAQANGHLETYTTVCYLVGCFVVQYCTVDLKLHLDGYGGAWGSYTGNGC